MGAPRLCRREGVGVPLSDRRTTRGIGVLLGTDLYRDLFVTRFFAYGDRGAPVVR